MERKEMLERIKEIKEERYCGTEQAFLYLKSLESAKSTLENLVSAVNKRLGENGEIEYPATEKNILCLFESCRDIFLDHEFVENLSDGILYWATTFSNFLDCNSAKTLFLYSLRNSLPNERDKLSPTDLQKFIDEPLFPGERKISFSEWQEFLQEVFLSSQKCEQEIERDEYLALKGIVKILSYIKQGDVSKKDLEKFGEQITEKIVTYNWQAAFSDDRFNFIEKELRDGIFVSCFRTPYQILRVLNDGEDSKFEVRRKILDDFLYSENVTGAEIKNYDDAEKLISEKTRRSYQNLQKLRARKVEETSKEESDLLVYQTLQRFLRNEKNWVKNYLKN